MENIVKKWKVHDAAWRPWDNRCWIAGEYLEQAISDNLERLVSATTRNDSYKENVTLQRICYSPGILGGTGGVVAEIKYYDTVFKRHEVVNAWIYADENFEPRTV